MALKSFYNTVAAGLIGGLVAHTLPESIDNFKKSFDEARAEQLKKPWSKISPREDGPGTFTVYSIYGGAMSFGVFRNAEGKIDSEGKPALTILDKNQDLIGQVWYRNGKLHREDGPALVGLNPVTGKAVCEEWYFNGERMDPWRLASFDTKPSIQPSPCETYLRNPNAQPF